MPDINLKTIRPKILYFVTPVALITTIDQYGHPNIGPVSSVWAPGYKLVLGLGCAGKTVNNLMAQKECVVNIPTTNFHQNIEGIAHLTGAHPVREGKRGLYRYEPDKFTAGGFSAIDSEVVRAPAIQDCPVQLEAILGQRSIIDFDSDGQPDVAAVTVKVVNVRAHENITIGDNHIDPQKWSPIIYNFRYYFSLGEALGKNFKAGN